MADDKRRLIADDIDKSIQKLVHDVRKSSIESCIEVVRKTDTLAVEQKERLNALLSILLPDEPNE